MEKEMINVSELSQEDLQTILQGVMSGNITLQEVKGFSDEHMEAIYTMAYNLYNSGKYLDGAEVFTTLTLFNPFVSKYWMGLGACLQMNKNFDNALNAYATAAITSEPKDPVPHLHAGECSLGKGDIENALKAFQMAIDFSKDRDAYAAVHAKATAFKDILNEKKAQ